MKGMETMIFSNAYYKVHDFGKVAALFEKLEKEGQFNLHKMDSQEIEGTFVRPYPKGHWNPLSALPGAMQVVGGVEVKGGILTIDTKTKSALAGLRGMLESGLAGAISFEREEFQGHAGDDKEKEILMELWDERTRHGGGWKLEVLK